MEKAIQAAYTYLMANPSDKIMKENLEYYLSHDSADSSMLKDLEENRFVQFYLDGVEAYNNEDYQKCIDYMEKSIGQYIRDDDQCRAFCEGEFDHGWHPDFVSSVANHYTYCLRCKHNCTTLLNFVQGVYYFDLFASHYEYLQFSYYKVGNLEEASRCAASYLILNPTSEDMLSNIQFYKSQENFQLDYFTPRSEARTYMIRNKYEIDLLNFVDHEFNKLMNETNETKVDFKENEDTTDIGYCPANKSECGIISINNTKTNFFDPKLKLSQVNGIKLLDEKFEIDYYPLQSFVKYVNKNNQKIDSYQRFATKSLEKTKRFIVDDIISQEECRLFMNILEVGGVLGDGYGGDLHPHTDLETFAGLTMGRVALLSYFGIFESIYLRTLLRVTERIKKIVEINFNLENKTNPLYFTYTHFACRQPIPDAEFTNKTLSHPIHADNCIISKTGAACSTASPAFSWRDYSAILYLNEDFEGGEFIFANDYYGDDVQCSVKPKCGRLVAFSSGNENLHGIKSVKRGKRCALAVWFTHNITKQEVDQNFAPGILRKIEENGSLHKQMEEKLKDDTYEIIT